MAPSQSTSSNILLGILLTPLSNQRPARPARHPPCTAVSRRSGPLSWRSALLVCAIDLLAIRQFAYAYGGYLDWSASIDLRVSEPVATSGLLHLFRLFSVLRGSRQ